MYPDKFLVYNGKLITYCQGGGRGCASDNAGMMSIITQFVDFSPHIPYLTLETYDGEINQHIFPFDNTSSHGKEVRHVLHNQPTIFRATFRNSFRINAFPL